MKQLQIYQRAPGHWDIDHRGNRIAKVRGEPGDYVVIRAPLTAGGPSRDFRGWRTSADALAFIVREFLDHSEEQALTQNKPEAPAGADK